MFVPLCFSIELRDTRSVPCVDGGGGGRRTNDLELELPVYQKPRSIMKFEYS